MSDMEKFEAMGGQIPDCAGLYRDVSALHNEFAAELQDYAGGPANTTAAELIAEGEVAYELSGQSKLDIGPDFADTGAVTFEPMDLTTPQGNFSLLGTLFSEAGQEVSLPRHIETHSTADANGLSSIVVTAEGQHFVVNSLDVDAAHEIATGEIQKSKQLDLQSFPEVMADHGGMDIRHLSEEDCAKLRHALGNLQHIVEVTASENDIVPIFPGGNDSGS